MGSNLLPGRPTGQEIILTIDRYRSIVDYTENEILWFNICIHGVIII